jgi:acyl-coenzyme A thioesterase PaaI-like protein
MTTAVRETLLLRAYTALKIPLISHVRPAVEELTLERCVVRLPLSRRTKNHLGSMYFGALAIGADLAGGLIAMDWSRRRRLPVALVFRDLSADFVAPATADVRFVCEEGAAIRALVERAAASDERLDMPVHVTAQVGAGPRAREVARFTMTLSLKRRRARRAG